jgi:prefoldin subunit 5
MKTLLLTLAVFASLNLFAQDADKANTENLFNTLNARVSKLNTENGQLKEDARNLKLQIKSLNNDVDSTRARLLSFESTVGAIKNQLSQDITDSKRVNSAQITEVNQALNTKSMLALLGIIIVLATAFTIYWILSRRQLANNESLIEKLNSTKLSIEASLVDEFTKQTTLMESELQMLATTAAENRTVPTTEVDHSLPLKLASEINLIERNIKLMDAKTKGIRQLISSVGKLKDNLSANGYEMVDLLGKHLRNGMKVIVTSSLPNDELDPGVEMISKIIIPQVNYNGVMIQSAQVEISIG